MNFVDTGSTALMTADTAVEAIESAAPVATKTASNAKAFFSSMVVALVFFPFTLVGMMSATNWVVDHVVIPRVEARAGDLHAPLTNLATPADETATANAADSAH